MRRIMNKIIFFVIPAICLAISACCGGADTIYSIEGISLGSPDTFTFTAVPPQETVLELNVHDSLSSHRGSRNCHHKDLAIAYDNSWRFDRFSLTCDRYFVNGTDTIPAHADLLKTAICRNLIKLDPGMSMASDSRIIISGFKQTSPAQNYKFMLEGHTSNNKTFKDSCTIFIR
jgi:hypothetical protein